MTSRPPRSATILPFGLPRPIAQERVRELVAEGKFGLVPKAKMNMLDRDFSMRQVLIALKEGAINQGPKLDEHNEWRCRISKRCAGKLVRVVITIRDMKYVNVISVH